MPFSGYRVLAISLPLLAALLVQKGQKYYFKSDMSSPKLHAAPHEILQPAFLYVTAEPGELATDAELNCPSVMYGRNVNIG